MSNQTNKALIGVTSADRIFFADDYNEGIRVSYTLSTITDAIMKAGGVPVNIPIHDKARSADFIQVLDGLVLSGGVDVTPHFYGENLSQQANRIDPFRDEREMALIQSAIDHHLPILGICRGMQLMNVYSGGSLYQDLSQNSSFTLKHDSISLPTVPVHRIQVAESSYFANLVSDQSAVNSYHHQVIKDLGQGLKAVAWADDGVVEAIESPSLNFVGVQYHPESLIDDHPDQLALFTDLIHRADKSV